MLTTQVGGSTGFVSVGLASAFPDLNFIVQDLEDVVVSGASSVPSDLKNRIKFMPHDFLIKQSIKNADVYLFR